MIEGIVGALIGAVAGAYGKDKIMGNSLQTTVENLQRQLNVAKSENQRLKDNETSLQEQVDKANAEMRSMRNKLRQSEDESDDRADFTADLKRDNERLRNDVTRLKQELNELQMQYTARKQELEALQDKYDELSK